MTEGHRIDDCLSVREGRLFVEECDSVKLIEQFGSPLFVVSEDQIRRNVRKFHEAFQRGWTHGPVKVMPAAKANWVTAVQRVLASEGCGADIYSAGELDVVLRCGFDPDVISVNGVPKDPAHVHRSIDVGARITIDSLEEVDMIAAATSELGKTARVRLRLKPTLSGFTDPTDFVAEGLVPTDIAAAAYKGGLCFEDAVSVGRRLLEMDRVELMGFHQHHGRHRPSTRYWEAQMRAFAAEIARVSAALGGYHPKEIDIGGGFAIPRDPHNAATDYTEPLQLSFIYVLSKVLSWLGEKLRYETLDGLIDRFVEMRPNAKSAPLIEEYGKVTTRTLSNELQRHGIPLDGVMLQLEPGRSIHGNAGLHLATVRSIKRQESPIHWNLVALDTTEFWFTGGRYEHHLHDYRVANKADARPEEKVDIIGRSCYGDRLLPTVRAPRMEVGDIFAFLDTGAYQEVSASNFNAMPRPATVLVSKDQAHVIRRRESLTDVFARDEVPEHLVSGAKGSKATEAA